MDKQTFKLWNINIWVEDLGKSGHSMTSMQGTIMLSLIKMIQPVIEIKLHTTNNFIHHTKKAPPLGEAFPIP